MANNYHRPEKICFLLNDMKRMGGRTLAYATQLEELVMPFVEQRLRQREKTRKYLRGFRATHPEYLEKCRKWATEANERKRAAKAVGEAPTNPCGTATIVKADGCPVG